VPPPPRTSGRGRRAGPPRRDRAASARAIPATRYRDGWWARRAAARRLRWPARERAMRASAGLPRRWQADARARPRRTPAPSPSPFPGRATDSPRASRGAIARPRSEPAAADPRRPWPSPPPARLARARSRAPRGSRRPGTRAGRHRDPAAAADRAARPGRPWRCSPGRGRSSSHRPASSAASSCRRRCARPVSSARAPPA
jgi:hypothetical protein